MPLSADPSVTYSAQGSIVSAGTALAAATSTTGAAVDCSSSSLGTWMTVTVTYTTVAATAGLTVSIYPAGDTTPHYDTVAMWSSTIPATASTTQQMSWLLPTGKYLVKVTNTDATNAVTYGITSNPIA